MLGPTTAAAAGRTVELRSQRQRRLVAALVLANGRVATADSLAEAVWGDRLPVDPGGALQNLVSRLRTALGASGRVIETAPGGYRLALDSTVLDTALFEHALRAARTGRPAARAAGLADALALWRGPAYQDLDTDGARIEAARLADLRLTAEEDGAAALAEAGEQDAAVIALEALCAREPLRERPRLELARSLVATGRRAEALRVLDDLRRVLAAELGIAPSGAVTAMYDSVLADDLHPQRVAPAPSVPQVLSAVFGRDGDIDGVRRRLADGRLVTLVGPGGVGKTTLALLVAASARAAYEHGCAYVDLATVLDPADVALAFGRGLGIDVLDPDGLVDRLIEALTDRRMLLLIDNAEQVVGRASETVSRLLAGSDGVDVLITSREPLNLGGERLWPVEPLPAADEHDAAVRLFCDRARAIRPGWEADAGEMAASVAICQRLDGLPLAIELAAAHVRFRSCGEILQELDRPLDLLHRPRSPGTRHSGLRAMVDWSYDLLEPLEASVFDRLCVFTHGFTRGAARSISADLADEQRVDGVLDALVDRSLVRLTQRPDGTRYGLLEPLRQYGLSHLVDGGQQSSARRGHAEVMLSLAEQADAAIAGPDEARWVRRLDDERADLVAACRWLVDHDLGGALRIVHALHFYAFPRGRADLMELVEMVLAGLSSTDAVVEPSRLAVLFGLAADRAIVAGDLRRAGDLLELGFAAAAGAAEEGADRYCRGAAGDLALFRGATDEASAHFVASAACFRAAGDDALAAWVTAAAALPDVYSGDAASARRAASAAVAAADASGCPSAMAFARYALAEASAPDDDGAARRLLDESIELAESVDAAYVAGLAHLSVATLESRSGDVADALPHYAALLEMWRRSGNWAQQWNTLRTLVLVLVDLGQHEEAVRLLAGIEAHAEAPRWGEDHARLVAAEQRLHRALGGARFEAVRLEGSGSSSAEVLAGAEAAVEALLSSR